MIIWTVLDTSSCSDIMAQVITKERARDLSLQVTFVSDGIVQATIHIPVWIKTWRPEDIQKCKFLQFRLGVNHLGFFTLFLFFSEEENVEGFCKTDHEQEEAGDSIQRGEERCPQPQAIKNHCRRHNRHRQPLFKDKVGTDTSRLDTENCPLYPPSCQQQHRGEGRGAM